MRPKCETPGPAADGGGDAHAQAGGRHSALSAGSSPRGRPRKTRRRGAPRAPTVGGCSRSAAAAARGGRDVPFYVLTAVAAFAFALCFTLNLVFQYRVVGLDPFKMVLVGTVLEATCFLFEVPTGLVADLHSRRVSVIVGFFLSVPVSRSRASSPRSRRRRKAMSSGGSDTPSRPGPSRRGSPDEVGEEKRRPVLHP